MSVGGAVDGAVETRVVPVVGGWAGAAIGVETAVLDATSGVVEPRPPVGA